MISSHEVTRIKCEWVIRQGPSTGEVCSNGFQGTVEQSRAQTMESASIRGWTLGAEDICPYHAESREAEAEPRAL